MRVRQQHRIDRRKVFHANTRTPEAMDKDEPVRKDRVDEDVESGELEKKRGVADEGDAQFAGLCGDGLVVAANRGTKCGFCDELESEADGWAGTFSGQSSLRQFNIDAEDCARVQGK
jgi:hypothetical protein